MPLINGRYSDEQYAALYELNCHLHAMSDEEFASLYDHVVNEEGGHPDHEYAELNLEGRLSDDLFRDALACERDRREATKLTIITVALPSSTSISNPGELEQQTI